MNYSPKGLYMWDAWYMPLGDEVHMYHLQRSRPDADLPPGHEDWLGHAVTRDLIEWEERPIAYGPQPGNPLEDAQPWTGCALWHQGQGYLFYTMRGLQAPQIQRIGLATTRDPDKWERYAGNPLIVPDSKKYASVGHPIPNLLDCRDLIIIPDPKGKGWLGFYATRQPGRELPETSCIACVWSADLINWEHRPPAFAPNKYACIEVPDVFEVDGLWYLTCLTGNWYGNLGLFSQPYVTHGTIFAVSERPEGPYEELKDNVLLGAHTGAHISCRTVMRQGERYLLYTDRERVPANDKGKVHLGTLSTPKLLKRDGQRLYPAYCPLIEKRITDEPVGPGRPLAPSADIRRWGQIWDFDTAKWTFEGDVVEGSSRTGWGIAPTDLSVESFIFEATVTLEHGRAAGLALRMDQGLEAGVVALDAEDQCVYFGEAPAFEFVERHMMPIQRQKAYRLRIVGRREHLEVYVDDELCLAFPYYRAMCGRLGCFVDRGKTRITGARVARLRVDKPE